MLRSGRLMMGMMAGLASVAAGGAALANDMSTPVAMAAAVQADVSVARSSSVSLAESAMGLMRAGRSADALALLEPAAQSLSKFGKGSRVVCGRAVAGGAVALEAGTCDALFMRAFALTELGRRADAIEALQQLTQLAPDNLRYRVELAFAYRSAGYKDQALAVYGQAAQDALKPELREGNQRYRAAALRGVGFILADKGDWDGAEQAYRTSLVEDPASKLAAKELQYIARKKAELASAMNGAVQVGLAQTQQMGG